MKLISYKTANTYSNIISRFIIISSSEDSDDIDKMLKSTFKL